jgi:hypothetical protein
MSYKVSFSVQIEVDGMVDEDGIGLTDAQLKDALQKKIDWIDANPGQAPDIAGRALYSVKENRWVLRKTDDFSMAGKADAGWVDSREISLSDTLSTLEASCLSLSYGTRGFWGKLEDMQSKPVLATLSSDDGRIVEKVDLTEWLATTDASWIFELAENAWEDCEAYSDAIAYLQDEEHPSCMKLFAYLNVNDGVGMSLIFDSIDAVMSFLEDCRPTLHEQIISQDQPSP